MVASYLPDQLLRNLTPQPMTRDQQLEADEQLGAALAALSRGTGRVTRRARSWARHVAGTGQADRAFRNR